MAAEATTCQLRKLHGMELLTLSLLIDVSKQSLAWPDMTCDMSWNVWHETSGMLWFLAAILVANLLHVSIAFLLGDKDYFHIKLVSMGILEIMCNIPNVKLPAADLVGNLHNVVKNV